MKLIYMFLLCFIFITAIASTSFCKGILVAAYSFEEGSGKVARDVTGNGHNGEIKNAKYVEGKFGKALDFDGVESQVEIPHSEDMNFKEGVTVEAWVKPSRYNDLSAVVQKWGDNTNRRQYLLCFVSNKVRMYISGSGATWPSSESKNVVKTDEWTHIAGTYDGKVIRCFINGKLETEVNNTEGLFASDVHALIGGYGPDVDFGSNRHFPGVIDEARYWSGALDENEIINVMKKSSADILAVDSLGKLGTTWGNIKINY